MKKELKEKLTIAAQKVWSEIAYDAHRLADGELTQEEKIHIIISGNRLKNLGEFNYEKKGISISEIVSALMSVYFV